MALSNLQPLAYAVAYITFVLGTISIFLRFYCRRCVLHLWGWDDHFTVLILVRGLHGTPVDIKTHLTARTTGLQHRSTTHPAHVSILGMWFV